MGFKILNIDLDRQRITLGLKQLSVNLYELFMHQHKIDSKIDATILHIGEGIVFLELFTGILSELPESEVSSVYTDPQVGDRISVLIVNIDKETGQVKLRINKEKPGKSIPAPETIGGLVKKMKLHVS